MTRAVALARRTATVGGGAEAFLVMAALLTCAPIAASSYWIGILVLLVLNAILVTSYRLITTMGGWSFAHVAIMGVGAYAVAILCTQPIGLPVWVAIGIGTMSSAVVAAAIALPVLRTRQSYFFLATFAAGEALRQCFVQFKTWTGGTAGIAFIPRPTGLSGNFGFYYAAAAIYLVLAALMLAFERSRAGRTVRAVGDNEDLARSLGVNAWGYRGMVFVLGSCMAGVAGGLLATYNGVVSPADFGATLMFKVVAAATVGGTARFRGPLVGLFILTIVEQAFRAIPATVPFIWGATVIAVLVFAPGGLDTRLSGLIGALRIGTARR